jgi:hypothetical protein
MWADSLADALAQATDKLAYRLAADPARTLLGAVQVGEERAGCVAT